jgi:membrane-bound lytic murein transglycosylase B
MRSIFCTALVVVFVTVFSDAQAVPTKRSAEKLHHLSVHHTEKAVIKTADRRNVREVKVGTPASMFAIETAMSAKDLINRWHHFIDGASKRTGLPSDWIRAVLMEESGGRTMMAENKPIQSTMGATGLMQLMPATWLEMRTIYKLGPDPNDPRDNILAGAAYLRTLYWEYGYPGLFAAYNDGPGMIEAHRRLKEMLPQETHEYVLDIASILRTGSRGSLRRQAPLFKPFAYAASGDEQDVAAKPVPTRYRDDNDDDYYGEQVE